MPQEVRCYGCGKELYKGDELKSPDEIRQMRGDRCPYCGKKLNPDFSNVEIKASSKYNETRRIKL